MHGRMDFGPSDVHFSHTQLGTAFVFVLLDAAHASCHLRPLDVRFY